MANLKNLVKELNARSASDETCGDFSLNPFCESAELDYIDLSPACCMRTLVPEYA